MYRRISAHLAFDSDIFYPQRNLLKKRIYKTTNLSAICNMNSAYCFELQRNDKELRSTRKNQTLNLVVFSFDLLEELLACWYSFF